MRLQVHRIAALRQLGHRVERKRLTSVSPVAFGRACGFEGFENAWLTLIAVARSVRDETRIFTKRTQHARVGALFSGEENRGPGFRLGGGRSVIGILVWCIQDVGIINLRVVCSRSSWQKEKGCRTYISLSDLSRQPLEEVRRSLKG